jgi:hypothetical protein
VASHVATKSLYALAHKFISDEGIMMTEKAASRIRLADAIAELRAEISHARQAGTGKDVRFSAKTIEVELSIDFELSAEANASVSKWIPFIDVGAKAKGGQKSLHKIKLTLEIDNGGTPSNNLITDAKGPKPIGSRS